LASDLVPRASLVERVAAARPSPSWYSWRISEASPVRALTPQQVQRSGYAYGVPPGGLNEVNAGIGASTQTDRKSELQQLYEAYLACPWAWACVNAVARTITAGGIVMDWDSDTGEGNAEAPSKPAAVLAMERLIAFTNPRQNIRQLMRNVVVDLEVFGDAFIEVVWWGGTPVALYNLDNPTTTPLADEHGDITGYKQVTEYGQIAPFEPRDVIHISMDAPRSGVFGVSATQANMLPITAWLFAAATGKEMFRKGLPPTVHADFPAGTPEAEQGKWVSQVMARNVGPRNIGRPWVTRGGATLGELQAGKVADVLAFLSQKRDEIIAGYGVPPSKVSIIESGNLGGGTGEEQDMTYRIDKCAPIAELILEAFNFAITRNGFGIADWHAKFREMDYRSSEVRERIRDTRIRNGSYTINKSRTEIGEPPVDGGDDAVIIDRQNLVLVKDLAAMSKATVEGKAGLPAPPPPGDVQQDGAPLPGAGHDGPPAEALAESAWDGGRPVMRAVYAQLARSFPPAAIRWVSSASWTGPRRVPLAAVDTDDRREWDASHEPGEVARFAAKLKRRHADGRELKPAVLVQRPDGKLLVADGHHRFLAYEQSGAGYVWAYTGKVSEQQGPWGRLALSQGRGAA